jgi:hypothetical protein
VTRGWAAVLVLLLAQACAIRAAWAEPSMDPPRYDSTSYCMRLSRTDNGFADEVQAQCLAQQRGAYDAIRRQWDETPEITQDGCDSYVRAVHPQDYVTMLGCIESQKRSVPPEPEGDLPQQDENAMPPQQGDQSSQ